MSLAQGAEIVKPAELTQDAFLGGRLNIAQPAKGFRAGLDSVLLGAAVSPGATSLLDLGAGVGTASLVALSDRPELLATLVESDPAMAALAVKNVAANGMSARAGVLTLDLTAPGRERAAAGLLADHFTTVIANPPFYDGGTSAAPARAAARQMPRAVLEQWVRTAATHAAPGGEIIFIHVAAMLGDLLAAFEPRFGAITVLPLTPRDGEAAHRVLVRGIKGSGAPLTLLASRSLHLAGGRDFQPAFDAIFRGTDRLHW